MKYARQLKGSWIVAPNAFGASTTPETLHTVMREWSTPLRGSSSSENRSLLSGSRTVHAASAVAELHRVVRPGGELRFNEHIASDRPLGAVQRTADATVWPTISGGCHLARDTATALEDGGFLIERVERFEFSVSALDPKKTHILGTARRV